MTAFVALLRGINVGGRNLVAMPALAQRFRDAGYGDVRTYIQSGNVLFTASGDPAELEDAIERMLAQRLEIAPTVVVRSREQLAAIVAAAPPDHGSDELRSDVMFLRRPLTADEVMARMPELREGVDAVAPGPGVIYFSRVKRLATTTRIQRFMSMPVFGRITMRNWRTVTRVAELLDELDAG